MQTKIDNARRNLDGVIKALTEQAEIIEGIHAVIEKTATPAAATLQKAKHMLYNSIGNIMAAQSKTFLQE